MMVEYSYSRLCFKADIIEPLNDEDEFAVHTPQGTFRMTKGDFHKTFPNYVKSKSYQEGRLYSIKSPTRKAMRFLVDAAADICIQAKCEKVLKDLVGDEIRERIKELGRLWRTSKHNPQIAKDVLDCWERVIDEWIADKDMPLIIRKDANKMKGQSVIHPSGRKIIVSDNTFAIWVYYCVMNNRTYSLGELKTMLSSNEIPMVFQNTGDNKEERSYTRPLGSYSLPEWKLCHIEPVGFNTRKTIEELDMMDIQEHFRKYANPCNMFVLPKEIGAIGEIQAFIDEQRMK